MLSREEFWALFFDKKFMEEVKSTLAGTLWAGCFDFETFYFGLSHLAATQGDALTALLSKICDDGSYLSEIAILDNGSARPAETLEEAKNYFVKAGKATVLYAKMHEVANLYDEYKRIREQIDGFKAKISGKTLPGFALDFKLSIKDPDNYTKTMHV